MAAVYSMASTSEKLALVGLRRKGRLSGLWSANRKRCLAAGHLNFS
jgi:hypothetical protein